jgi:hypothetical protein
MGYMCQGGRLRDDHPFFLTRKVAGETDSANRHVFNTTSYKAHDQQQEDYYDSDDDEVVELVDEEEDTGDDEGEDVEMPE